MNMIAWDERSSISSNLLNPAFCGELVRKALASFQKETEAVGIDYALVFLILPLLLHKPTRESLPRTKTTKLLTWLQRNPEIKAGLPLRIKFLVPHTREAVLFSWRYGKISFLDDGKLAASKNKREITNSTSEVKEILKQAEFLGRWIATYPSLSTVYGVLGIIP